MSAEKISEQTIFQPVMVKQIADNKALVKELLRSTVIGLIAGNCLPLGVENKELMLKKVSGITLGEVWSQLSERQKEEMMEKLAGLLLEIRLRYKDEGRALIDSVGKEITWDEFLVKNEEFLLRGGENLNVDLNQLGRLKRAVRQSRSVKSDLTLVHGDLGLSNIMLKGVELALIDFEHTVGAPIELELAVGNFWEDENSLPVELLVEKLRKVGVRVSEERLKEMTKVYLVNQLRIAMEEENEGKVELLINKAEERGVI